MKIPESNSVLASTPSTDISMAELKSAYEALKKERQLAGYRKGGRFKASTKQRTTAKQTIQQTKPWESFKGQPSPVKDRSRSRFNNKSWLKAEYSAPTEAELDRVTAGVCEALAKFQSEMKRLGLGKVTIEIKSTMEGRGVPARLAMTAANTGIVLKFTRSVKVRLSKWKQGDQQAIALLWRECQRSDFLTDRVKSP